MHKKNIVLMAVLAFFTMMCFSSISAAAKDEKTQSVRDMVEGFTKDLNRDERAHFMIIYSTYNLFSVVKIVREDVGNAIESCGKENPDMKANLNARHKEWDKEVAAAIDESEANMKNMIAAQEYKKRKEFKSLFKFLDEKRAEKNKNIEKIPVTTAEACTHLRDKMDETQEDLTARLRATLVSLPHALRGVGDDVDDAASSDKKDQ